MRLLDITLQNLKRRASKAALVVLSLTIAVSLVIAMVVSSKALSLSISSKMDDYGANIVVTPKSDQLALSYGGMTLPGVTTEIPEFDATVLDRIASIGGANTTLSVAPKVVGTVQSGPQQLLVVGIDFERELTMKKWWRIEGSKPVTNSDVLIGANVATELGKKPGDSLLIGTKIFDVAGVLGLTGSSEDDIVMAEMKTVQTLLGRGNKITFLEVSAGSGAPVDKAALDISAAVPEARVTTLKQAIEGKKQVMERFSNFGMALSVVVLIASGFSMLTMMMSSVNQRTREIGILRAVGYRRTHISTVILSEAFFMSLVGGVTGFILGSASGRLIAIRLLDAQEAPVGFAIFAASLALSISVGLLSAYQPASRAASIDPARSLRFI